jgi:hypothetical protein
MEGRIKPMGSGFTVRAVDIGSANKGDSGIGDACMGVIHGNILPICLSSTDPNAAALLRDAGRWMEPRRFYAMIAAEWQHFRYGTKPNRRKVMVDLRSMLTCIQRIMQLLEQGQQCLGNMVATTESATAATTATASATASATATVSEPATALAAVSSSSTSQLDGGTRHASFSVAHRKQAKASAALGDFVHALEEEDGSTPQESVSEQQRMELRPTQRRVTVSFLIFNGESVIFKQWSTPAFYHEAGPDETFQLPSGVWPQGGLVAPAGATGAWLGPPTQREIADHILATLTLKIKPGLGDYLRRVTVLTEGLRAIVVLSIPLQALAPMSSLEMHQHFGGRSALKAKPSWMLGACYYADVYKKLNRGANITEVDRRILTLCEQVGFPGSEYAESMAIVLVEDLSSPEKTYMCTKQCQPRRSLDDEGGLWCLPAQRLLLPQGSADLGVSGAAEGAMAESGIDLRVGVELNAVARFVVLPPLLVSGVLLDVHLAIVELTNLQAPRELGIYGSNRPEGPVLHGWYYSRGCNVAMTSRYDKRLMKTRQQVRDIPMPSSKLSKAMEFVDTPDGENSDHVV